ncbi:TonB-dependent receptor [Novosphingobium sediminicola]|uniref:Iron complex outermembrane receptor protein n=1 Tax=Novosphingobium sediminicola TaxID=563162 RepID=A0A7W6G593_9SPHN|nr:TonB-dependent receptor [Novosphingobium sediminicola]MBB3954444.1 iron complex outermembrane receptor protein [Novosphingobium sediminicola]
MNSTIRSTLTASAALAVLTLAMPAMAAEQNTGAQNTDEIIVTAQKTASVASKVPIALSVFSGEQLKEKGVTNVSNLSAVTPGLEIGSAAHGVSISVRGVTTTDITSKGEQDIVFSTDGIPVGRPQLMGLAFFDLDRVEVLRGPQGTLYGKSATGGAINVITAKPTHDFAASASAELGNYNTRRFDAMVNLPVTDSFALRAAVTSNSREGFIQPVLGTNTFAGSMRQAPLGAENNWAARITGKYDFGNNGSLVLTGTFGHVGGADSSGTVIYSRVTQASGADRFKVYYNPFAGSQGANDNFAGVNAELGFDLGPVRVTYDGAHMWWHGEDNTDPSVNGSADSGAYSWTQYSSHLTTDSHELRLSNATPGRLDYVLGANYIHEYNNESDLNWQTQATATCVAQPSTTGCNAPNPHIVGPNIHTSKGVFGQINYHVNDKLKLTFGGRYSKDDMARYALLSAGPAPAGGWLTATGAPCAPPAPCVSTAQSQPDTGVNSTSAFTWRVGADYQITPRMMVYASVATGYKGGGFNDIDPTATTKTTGTYGAERVTAYEAGFKGRITPTLSYNTSAYYYDYSKYQLTGATFLALTSIGAVGVVIYTSLAPATMYGWENELTWKPSANDTFNLSLSLEKAKFNNGPDAARVGFVFSNQVNWGGRSLDRVPGVSGTVAYDHKFQLADGGFIKAGFNTKFSDGYWLSDLGGTGNPFTGAYTALPQQYRQRAYTRTDLTLGYTANGGKFSLDAYVRNLENKVQLQSAPTTPQPGWGADGQWVRVNLPRTFGVRATVRF